MPEISFIHEELPSYGAQPSFGIGGFLRTKKSANIEAVEKALRPYARLYWYW